MTEQSIGDMIRRVRRERGLTQDQAAAQLGVHQATVAKWERGDRVASERIPAIAEWLGRPVTELVARAFNYEPDELLALLREVVTNQDRMLAEMAVLRGELRGILGESAPATSEPSTEPPAPRKPRPLRRRR